MAKDKKPFPTPEQLKELHESDYFFIYPMNRYAKKLGNENWGAFGKMTGSEAIRQAKLILHRLYEIEKSMSLDTKREGAFLKCYVRFLIRDYTNWGNDMKTPGLPKDFVTILDFEYPGFDAVKRLMAHEEKKPLSKIYAVEIVKEHPEISQGELARAVGVTQATIRGLTPELLAAGWNGAHYAMASEVPVKPKSPGRSAPTLAPVKWMERGEPE